MSTALANTGEERGESISQFVNSEEHDNGPNNYDRDLSGSRRQMSRSDDEGVEVVLEARGKSTVVDAARPPLDQNVFRAPHAVRPRAVRPQHGPPPHVKSSGSYGYGGPPPQPPSEYAHRPYPVPYNPSGSFDDGSYHQPPSHYSPHAQYPPPGGRHQEDVNVISPNHKGGNRPPVKASRRYGAPHHYQYPPTSPVSRPGAPPATSPPRIRNYAMKRPEGPYSAAQRGRGHSEDGAWRAYPTPDRSRPPLVTESSFESDHYSSHASHASHPTTPNAPHYGPPVHHDRQYGFQGGSFGGSFDSHAPPPPHFDDYRYYNHHSPHHPPESPYSPSYSYQGYSPGGYYDQYSPHPEYGHHPHSYEDEDGKRYGDGTNAVTPNDRKKNDSNSGIMEPKAAQEVDFDISDPPMEPITPPSKTPVCDSPGDINPYDVLCGRGGGTNSQVGNRRFRKLVQEFQPTYLLARRKEKPLLARTIVLVIRKRAGRFLKKDDETGELYEVGDAKAEAKTSQALREGLDVRATKSAASTIMDKKKKKGKAVKEEDEEPASPEVSRPEQTERVPIKAPESPPTLPRLNGEEKLSERPPSPEQMQFRKRRRMRSGDAVDTSTKGCDIGFQDKLFPDFCPPRADLARATSPTHGMASPTGMDVSNTPTRRNPKYDDDDIRYETEAADNARGCAGIALDIVTGAAVGSFCLGPRKWR